ncbi:conserved oligomeric Golgi complex component [Blyttiomyces sp. JEL0837]|nr:conserved oligomeric Golgi complex component [Blyttiomyces sp. JEL0837]
MSLHIKTDVTETGNAVSGKVVPTANSSTSPTATNAPGSAVRRGSFQSNLHGHELLVSLLVDTYQKKVKPANDASAAASRTMSPLYTTGQPPSPTRMEFTSPTNEIRQSTLSRKHSKDSIDPTRSAGGSTSTSFKPFGSSKSSDSTVTWSTFRDPEYQAYLNHLTSCSLENLRAEPIRLAEEAARIEAQLADLAFTEHRSFLEANACSQSIRTNLTQLDSRLSKFSNGIPSLEKACRQFEKSSAEVMEDRRKMATVLAQHQRLLEILEIPQLMDTFIRNGYYEEAMDLQLHVNRLKMRHPNLKIIQQVADEVSQSTSLMLSQLISLLRGNSKHPLCIRVIGYLRRLEVFTEPELRLVFLQQKDSHFKKLLSEVYETDPHDYLKKYIEISREHFFDIITQYKAIFTDLPSSGSSSTPLRDSFPGSPSTFTPSAGQPTGTTQASSAILSSYVQHTMQAFLKVLEEKVPQIQDSTMLHSIVTQSMYYGMSLGRVGVDFRQLMSETFVKAVDTLVRRGITTGVTAFVSWAKESQGGVGMHMKTNAMVYGNPFGDSSPSTTRKASISGGSAPGSAGQPIVYPPAILLSYPPLAQLLNAFFAAFNQLRVIAPVSLWMPLSAFIRESLATVIAAVAEIGAELERQGGNESAMDDFGETCRVVLEIFVPAVLNGFEGQVYRSVASFSAGANGGGSGDGRRGSGSVSGDTKELTAPLVKYLPKPAPPKEREVRMKVKEEEVTAAAATKSPTSVVTNGNLNIEDVDDDKAKQATSGHVSEEVDLTAVSAPDHEVSSPQVPVPVEQETQETAQTEANQVVAEESVVVAESVEN